MEKMFGVYTYLWSLFIYYIQCVVFVFILTGNLILWMILYNLLWHCRDWDVLKIVESPRVASWNLTWVCGLLSFYPLCSSEKILVLSSFVSITHLWIVILLPFVFTSQGWINTVLSTPCIFCALALDHLSPLLGWFLHILVLEMIVQHTVSSMTSRSSSRFIP